MNFGCPKIDKHFLPTVKAMMASGRWEMQPGKKHTKLVMPGVKNGMVSVTGSTTDQIRAVKNFIATVRKAERMAGYDTTSV
jgi:hypothetical protein